MAMILLGRRFINPELAHSLMDLSFSVRYEDPKQMLHWADLARAVADLLSDEAAEAEAKVFDLKAKAWGYFGNALRVCGRLREAEEAFATAQGWFRQGSGDPLLEAQLNGQTSSLYLFVRDFDKAIRLSQEAGAVYEAVGDEHSLALSLIQGATAHIYKGEPEKAVSLLNRAVPLLNTKRDPLGLLAASHNLVRCYIDLGMSEQALMIYRDIQDLYKESEDTLILLRIRWQEGQLLRDIGSLKGAEEALLAARDGFRQRGLVYEAAVVSLDLATVQTKQGLGAEALQTSSEAFSTFRALHIDRESLASLILAIRSYSN